MPEPSARSRVCNVLVIGAGAAGLRAAIAATEAGSQVLIVGKRHRLDAHTVLAAGGINAVLGTCDPQDTWEQHFADTLREGYFLGHPRVVEIMAREAPDAVRELAAWGCRFATLEDGRLDQRFFGAHKYRRTCYAGDYTGRAILYTLANKVQQLGIPVIEDQYISRLLVADGVCFGAYGFDLVSGERTVFEADAVVLATGGHTRLWRRSSSRRDENYGEGMFLALEAGCRLMDMELVQFHPTGMLTPEEMAGTLVTEAVRGEGGRLYNRDHERFMQRYDPQRMELSARDRVALAIYTEIMDRRMISSRSSRGCTGSSSNIKCSISRSNRWRWRRRRTIPWAASPSIPRPTPPRWSAFMPLANAPRGCTAPTASGATHWPRPSSSDGGPGPLRPHTRRNPSCSVARERR
jgi:succinate dehydrogenase / fumarate reductase flavoprotein subunit